MTTPQAPTAKPLASANGCAADKLITAVAKAMWNVTVERERETPLWDELNAYEQAEWKIYAGVAIKTVQQHNGESSDGATHPKGTNAN